MHRKYINHSLKSGVASCLFSVIILFLICSLSTLSLSLPSNVNVLDEFLDVSPLGKLSHFEYITNNYTQPGKALAIDPNDS
jgi:hypothetical protein